MIVLAFTTSVQSHAVLMPRCRRRHRAGPQFSAGLPSGDPPPSCARTQRLGKARAAHSISSLTLTLAIGEALCRLRAFSADERTKPQFFSHTQRLSRQSSRSPLTHKPYPWRTARRSVQRRTCGTRGGSRCAAAGACGEPGLCDAIVRPRFSTDCLETSIT